MRKSVELSEDVKKVLGDNNSLSYAYTLDGDDYFVSTEVFKDKVQGVHGILLVVKNKASELIMHLPYLKVSKNVGFSSEKVADIQKRMRDDQLHQAFKYSPGFRKKFGKDFRSI